MFERLREIRIARKISCEQLSALLGLKTRSAYQKKEMGNIPFKLEEAKQVADFFGMNMEDIFFTEEVSCGD